MVQPKAGIFTTNFLNYCTDCCQSPHAGFHTVAQCRFFLPMLDPGKHGWKKEGTPLDPISLPQNKQWHQKNLIRCGCGNERTFKIKQCGYSKASLSCSECHMCEANQQICWNPKLLISAHDRE